jgi:hypothetical protein
MITFKQYLSEDAVSEAVLKKWKFKEVEVATAIKLLNSRAKNGLNAIQNGGLIYRGFKNFHDHKNKAFMIMDSSTGTRTSKDTNNIYQLLLASSNAMRDYPDRGKSFICTTDINSASGYGTPVVMVPFDGTKIAVSEHADYFDQVFDSPVYSGTPNNMGGFSPFLKSVGIKTVKAQFTDATAINKALAKMTPEQLLIRWNVYINDSIVLKDKSLGEHLDNFDDFELMPPKRPSNHLQDVEKAIAAGNFTCSKSTEQVYDLFKSTTDNRFDALATVIMTPETTDLELVEYGNAIDDDVECWFSGKCVAISFPMFAQILSKLQRQDFPISQRVLDTWEDDMIEFKYDD